MTATLTPPPVAERAPGRHITHWDPEDETFWRVTGRRVARRNLVWSILVEHFGFSIWLLWSAVAVSLPAAGFAFTVDQLFWLVAVPNLVGAVMRLPYTAAVARFGGRTWTTVSSALLLIPIGLMTACVLNPATPYWMFLVAATTAGLGGGNFASSMANISYFYPERHKGVALGVNAAGGNLGVAVVQFAVPLVIVAGAGLHLEYAPLLWLLPVVAATVGAWLFMDNLAVTRAPVREQAVVLRNRHTWVMSFLYIGTFGSFIGYSAALPLLVKGEFPAVAGALWAALGPLVGSAARPVGGWLADRFGGARVTALTFVAMGAGVGAVLLSLRAGSFAPFLAGFLLLFVASGVGNGSTYRMIPAIFRGRPKGRTEAAAVIGIAAAVGALGGFLIPRGFGMSIAATGGIDAALWVFLAGYAVCLAVTWACYLRRVPAGAI
ncbi:MFS transporter [Spirilliplanes yamanashiensis]|uniref:MFS transporter n=1 Tax=Spirilliplanes yamanashiensis TaxID=42233 RepID=A0A8J3YBW5_9ACTN|nr:MFS transporter [Spirilliplanes yamanashiensis]MDP9818073.1 NNP family nitrate/nitrite transporter-like MFS transporter [Spirilliplanes yamanashiensis]GIJ04883.1 MFS transporter [Spirilliplanes yamanashiensis]